MDFKRPLKAVWHSEVNKEQGQPDNSRKRKSRRRRQRSQAESFRREAPKQEEYGQTGTRKMARFEMCDIELAVAGGQSRADVFCNLGLIYATGRGCPVDLVAAHKWLNIAAIKGSERAASLRADLARNMTKADLAAALRAARDWMTTH